MHSKHEGYGDDFTVKCVGHCNGIQVNGIHTQGNLAKSFALPTKKTVTYCGKCICLCSKTTPSNRHCMYWKTFWIVNWATSIQEYRIIPSSSGFQLGSSIKTRSIFQMPISPLCVLNTPVSLACSRLVPVGLVVQLVVLGHYPEDHGFKSQWYLIPFPLWPYSSDSGTDNTPHCSFNTFPLPLVAL